MQYNVGLILEGGGMRCEYTAGVLDFFMDNNFELKGCYGVSAGAVCGMNYIAKQKGRTLRITRDYIHDRRYCSLHSLLTTGNLFGVDMLYNRIPNELDPFDYNSFLTSESRLTAVLTDTATGRPYYKTIRDVRQHMPYLQASCSLPLVSKMVEIDGRQYLDGGITDSIPLAKSIADGYTKNIVILTRHGEYQKKPERLNSLAGRLMYARYPQLLKAGLERHTLYNRQLELVREQERAGKALVFRPKQPITIGRTEKNKAKLTALYEQGYADAQERLDELKLFIREENAMSIAVIGHCRDDTERLAGRMHEYGLGHGYYIEFTQYTNETELAYGLLSRRHTGVIIALPGADGLPVAYRISALSRSYRVTMLTDDKRTQCDSYDVPVELCLRSEVTERTCELIYKKMIFI